MSFKTLHEFTVTLEKEVKEVKTEEKDGQKITTESTTVKEVPYTIVLKELNRGEKREIALFQSVQYNDAINKGLLPKLIMQQKAGKELGNPLSEEEDKNLSAMNARLQELANDYIDLTGKTKELPNPEEVNERKQKLIMEYMVLSKRVIDINAAYQTVYAHTAETYMQNKTLAWLQLFLTYIKDTPESAPRPMFNGVSFESKEQAWADLEDGTDPLFQKCYDKLAIYWGLYYMGRANKSEDFVEYEENEKKRVAYEQKMKEEAAQVEADKKKDKKDGVLPPSPEEPPPLPEEPPPTPPAPDVSPNA